MDILYTVMDLLGGLLRLGGLLVFGAAAGWLVLNALRRVEFPWPYHVLITFILFTFVAVLTWRLSPAALGAFTLGAGAGLLFWGLRKPGKKPDASKDEPVEDDKAVDKDEEKED